eukprot:1878140-Pleurochrysis_carterae.AAC.4
MRACARRDASVRSGSPVKTEGKGGGIGGAGAKAAGASTFGAAPAKLQALSVGAPPSTAPPSAQVSPACACVSESDRLSNASTMQMPRTSALQSPVHASAVQTKERAFATQCEQEKRADSLSKATRPAESGASAPSVARAVVTKSSSGGQRRPDAKPVKASQLLRVCATEAGLAAGKA